MVLDDDRVAARALRVPGRTGGLGDGRRRRRARARRTLRPHAASWRGGGARASRTSARASGRGTHVFDDPIGFDGQRERYFLRPHRGRSSPRRGSRWEELRAEGVTELRWWTRRRDRRRIGHARSRRRPLADAPPRAPRRRARPASRSTSALGTTQVTAGRARPSSRARFRGMRRVAHCFAASTSARASGSRCPPSASDRRVARPHATSRRTSRAATSCSRREGPARKDLATPLREGDRARRPATRSQSSFAPAPSSPTCVDRQPVLGRRPDTGCGRVPRRRRRDLGDLALGDLVSYAPDDLTQLRTRALRQRARTVRADRS